MKWDRVQEFNKPNTSEPVTPEPDYICVNCGMLVKNGHGHTLVECMRYADDEYTPDHRAMVTLLPSRNNPKVHLPFYR